MNYSAAAKRGAETFLVLFFLLTLSSSFTIPGLNPVLSVNETIPGVMAPPPVPPAAWDSTEAVGGGSGRPCRDNMVICRPGESLRSYFNPWYGIVVINEFGDYDQSNSKAFNVWTGLESGGEIPGGAADCFIKIIAVLNDGRVSCYETATNTWSAANCNDISSLYRVDRTEAYSGKYTILHEPIQWVDEDPDLTDPAFLQYINETWAQFIVVDSEYIILGVNDGEYMKTMWEINQRPGESRDYHSAELYMVYTIGRACDFVYPINDTRNCKNERIFDRQYDFVGANAENVYSENVERQGYQPCAWMVIDYGKYYLHPGVMLVLLNRSQFGSQMGFIYHSIVGMENQFIDHIYDESYFPGTYPGGPVGGTECCHVSQDTGWSQDMCVEVGSCSTDYCIYGDSCSPAGGGACGDACESSPMHDAIQTVLKWNREAAERLFGCDKCEEGDTTCSMGSSLADWREFFTLDYLLFEWDIPWPRDFDDALLKCGYYAPWNWNPYSEGNPNLYTDCDCRTGWTTSGWCSESDCKECNKKGYGCQYEGGMCLNCWDPNPSGRVQENFTRESLESIETNVTGNFSIWSRPTGSIVCGHNEGDGYDGLAQARPWCGATAALDSGYGCAIYDCMFPWNNSAESIYPSNQDWIPFGVYYQRQGWDILNRGGQVVYDTILREGYYTYDDYPTLVPPEECSDFLEDDSTSAFPRFWGDRYTECEAESGLCNCTRPQHDPKKHTPCPCDGINIALPADFSPCIDSTGFSGDCWWYELPYYRLFSRDTVWSNVFKLTPEVSNATIRDCTREVSCAQTWSALMDVRGMSGFTEDYTPMDLCDRYAAGLVCDGCYYSGGCQDCSDLDECSDLPATSNACNRNGCDFKKKCYLGSGSCRECPAPGNNPCVIYDSFESCYEDPCGFQVCGWDRSHGECRTEGYTTLTCNDICGGGCSKEECRSAAKIATDSCTYDYRETVMSVNPACRSCEGVRGCTRYGSEDSCRDDLCSLGCFWQVLSDDTEICTACAGVNEGQGCGGYSGVEACNTNPCSVDGGCAFSLGGPCTSCAWVERCEDYDEDSCYENPCNIGWGCGWDKRADDGEGKCLPRGSLSGENCWAVTENNYDLEECITDTKTLVAGGCWSGRVGLLVHGWGCGNCDGISGYPVKTCRDYSNCEECSHLNDGGKGGCLRDDCGVGPCAWDPDRGDDGECIPAFTAEPGEGEGWVRSFGVTADESVSENIGGGSFYVHAAGGMSIPNQSEAEGYQLEPEHEAKLFRNGSIWSEVKNYSTTLVLAEYRSQNHPMYAQVGEGAGDVRRWNLGETVGWDNLMACDRESITCGPWTDIQLDTVIRGQETTVSSYSLNALMRVPIPVSGAPPQVCGTLCAKRVTWWPKYFDIRTWLGSMWGGWLNLTICQKPLGAPLYICQSTPYLKRPLDSETLWGNVLPQPSHPYNILNWYNMPPYTDPWAGFRIGDGMEKIMVKTNYTFNVSLYRNATAMECLWDGCLHLGGYASDPEQSRCFMDELVVPWCDGRCEDLAGGGCVVWGETPGTGDGPGGCDAPWFDCYWKCVKWETHIAGWDYDDPSCTTPGCPWHYNYVCGCNSLVPWPNMTLHWVWNYRFQLRCIGCWTHDRCDYPLWDDAAGRPYVENITDSSSVNSTWYGKNLSISRPLPMDPFFRIDMRGYLEAYGETNITGYLEIEPNQDILNGFNIIFPDNYVIEYNARNYPVEHDLYLTERAWSRDDCVIPLDRPGRDSEIICELPDVGLDCVDYPLYRQFIDADGEEHDAQMPMCFDEQTKFFLNLVHPLRQSDNLYFTLVNNPLKKYYHMADTFFAKDKNYSWETILYGKDAGWGWFDITYWIDQSTAIGLLRNYHEDEEYYYDMAALYPNLVPGQAVYKTLFRNYTMTNIRGHKLNRYASLDGYVKYDKNAGKYIVYFTSRSIPVEALNSAKIRFFTHYRAIDKYLIDFGSAGMTGDSDVNSSFADMSSGNDVNLGAVYNGLSISRGMGMRIVAYPSNPDAYDDVEVRVYLTNPSAVPNARIYVSIGPPYNIHEEVSSGDPVNFQIGKTRATITAKYPGYHNVDTATYYMANKDTLIVTPSYPNALDWIMSNFLLILVAFVVLVSYRFFVSKRLSFYEMLQESGLKELLDDFFGFK